MQYFHPSAQDDLIRDRATTQLLARTNYVVDADLKRQPFLQLLSHSGRFEQTRTNDPP